MVLACITVKDWEEAKPHQKQQKQAYDTTKPVGIDVGLMNWLALSDGKVLQNTLNFAVQARKIKQLQRNLSRKKKKGSKNRERRLGFNWQRHGGK